MVNTEGMNAVCGLVLAVSPLQVMQCEGNKVGAHQKLRDSASLPHLQRTDSFYDGPHIFRPLLSET